MKPGFLPTWILLTIDVQLQKRISHCSTVNSLDCIILCHGMLSRVPGLNPLIVSTTSPSPHRRDSQICLHTMQNVIQEAKLPPIESHYFRLSKHPLSQRSSFNPISSVSSFHTNPTPSNPALFLTIGPTTQLFLFIPLFFCFVTSFLLDFSKLPHSIVSVYYFPDQIKSLLMKEIMSLHPLFLLGIQSMLHTQQKFKNIQYFE